MVNERHQLEFVDADFHRVIVERCSIRFQLVAQNKQVSESSGGAAYV